MDSEYDHLTRPELYGGFERALVETKLPERPDYEAANEFLLKARMEMMKLFGNE